MFWQIFLLPLILELNTISTSQSIPKSLQMNKHLIDVLMNFKKLEQKIPKENLRTITTLGLLIGAIETEINLENSLTNIVADLILNLNSTNLTNNSIKINQIEKIIERDRCAINILGNTLDLASETITNSQYHKELKKLLKDIKKRERILKNKKKKNENENLRDDQKIRLENLKKDILLHLSSMQSTINEKSNSTLVYLKNFVGLNESQRLKRFESLKNVKLVGGPKDDLIEKILKNSIEKTLVRRDNSEINDLIKVSQQTENNKTEFEKQDDIPESVEVNMPGGLVGLLATLSGGEGGSDIGALVGALTGFISQLFGPNGLDVPSLISTGTSLIAGLLSGGRDFGVVLGEFVGLALDGVSGGGGAINNGKFLGNLIGTILAELSADPEDDDEPPKPKIFIQTFLNSLIRAQSKKPNESSEDDNKSENNGDGDDDNANPTGSTNGSDSFGFLTHILRTVIGGVTSFVLNASLGSSGGSSKGSSSILMSSSAGKS